MLSFNRQERAGRSELEGAPGWVPHQQNPWTPSGLAQVGTGLVAILTVFGLRLPGCGPHHELHTARISPSPLAQSQRTLPRPPVRAGAKFEKGKLVERPERSDPDQQVAGHAHPQVFTIAGLTSGACSSTVSGRHRLHPSRPPDLTESVTSAIPAERPKPCG